MPDVLHKLYGRNRRRQETAPGEFADEVYTRGAWDSAVALGRAYVLGTGRQTLAVAGNVRQLVSNPTGSGVLVTIHGLGALSTGTGWANVYRNPNAGLPTAAARVGLRANAQAGQARKTELRVDTNTTTALGGGTDTGLVIGLPGGSRVGLQLGLLLFPGESLGLNTAFAGAADVAGSLYVTEEDL